MIENSYGGLISMKDFTVNTRADIRNYYQQNEWEELFDFISPETAALMFFRLRQAPDEIFSHGKWATIQPLEAMINTMMSEVREIEAMK